MLAKNSQAPRSFRKYALSLTFFASKLAPTDWHQGLLPTTFERWRIRRLQFFNRANDFLICPASPTRGLIRPCSPKAGPCKTFRQNPPPPCG
ncbi:hypothetical protein PspCFBP13528_23260 [Pseudomonas sp. CFBP13528]|nr:hypothetical protein PspCFBP13528_23260 [Pseudomonas sp. CFBP13528]